MKDLYSKKISVQCASTYSVRITCCATLLKQYLILSILILTCVNSQNSDKEYFKNLQAPYPGYLESLNSTVISLIAQLQVYKDYIEQAFKPLETYSVVFPKSAKDVEKSKMSLTNQPLDSVSSSSNQSSSSPIVSPAPDKLVIPNKNNMESTYVTEISPEGLKSLEKFIQETKPATYNKNDSLASVFHNSDDNHRKSQANKIDQRFGGEKNKTSDKDKDSMAIIFPGGRTTGGKYENKGSFRQEVRCGKLVEHGQAQWNVAIGLNGTSGFDFKCGGILLNSQYIITSASCVQTEKMFIRLSGSIVRYVPIQSIKVHEEYSQSLIYNDIALLKLEIPLGAVNNSIIPCLASSPTIHKAIATDWKFKLVDHKFGVVPIQHEVRIISSENCERLYRKYYHSYSLNFDDFFPRGMDSSLICAKIPKFDQRMDCRKNTGYQLISTDLESINFLLGTGAKVKAKLLDDSESSCDLMALPGIYTNIKLFSSWILENISSV